MRVLVTGASGALSRAVIPRLRVEGHDVVLHDLNRLPEHEVFAGLPFFQGDLQAGIAIERASAGCDAIVHTPAWHGMHSGAKTEADFWRLNVDGTFWTFQAAVAAGAKRFVFISSVSWHGHYDKYGFTKRVGEELCEYYRRNHGVRYVTIRPHDFTPWRDFANGYGRRLLYGGVDREDVATCVLQAARTLQPPLAEGAEAEDIVAYALRANAFTEDDLAGWEADALAACERIFPGSRALVEKYGIDIRRKPEVVDLGEGAARIGYVPQHHFGTFIEELRRLDADGGPEAVAAVQCPY